MVQSPNFSPGSNIAIKVPPHQYKSTVEFYCDILGFKRIISAEPAVGFEFGGKNLWIDSVSGISQAEIWLEIVTTDIDAASRYLSNAGIVRCDEIEKLPEGLQAFWISSPSSIIHLICKDQDSW